MLYTWTAQTRQNILYPQFNEEGKELPFKVIQEIEKNNNLAMLHLQGKRDTNYAVDLRDGIFYVNSTAIKVPFSQLKDVNYRIIFWRRMRKETGPEAKHKGEQYLHAILLGWQVTLEGKNIQQIMYIYPHSKGEMIEFKEKI
jgi:hypothetical protein